MTLIRTRKRNLVSAFTLIEVLVVLAILGIIMAVGSVRFRDFARRQAVFSAKRQMLSDVRIAQSDASSGRKPAGCTGTLAGYGFRVTGTAAPASYEIFARCGSGAGTADFVTQETDLAVGITITTPSVNPVIFKPLSDGTNLSAGSTVTITINSTTGGVSDALVIRASGEIQ